MKKFIVIVLPIVTAFLGIFILSLFNGCNTVGEDNGDNAMPVLSSLSPSSAVSHMPSFTLTAYGANFKAGSTILFRGIARETTFVDNGELTCRIDPDDTPRNTDADHWDIPVSVRNPAPFGGDSGTLNFAVSGNHTFYDPVSITSDDGGRSSMPRMALDDDGNISVVYEFWDALSDTTRIRFTRSTDGGETWESPLDLGDCSGGCVNPCIAVDADGNPDVVFNEGNRVCFVRSGDGGVTWSEPAYLSASSANEVGPVIAADAGGSLNVLWAHREGVVGYMEYRVYFIRSVDNGNTWSTAVNAFSDWGKAFSVYNVSMAVDGIGGIYASWTIWPVGGSRYSFVYLNYSHDYGVTWNEKDVYLAVCNRSDLAVDNEGNPNIVLESATLPFLYDVRFRKSVDRGVTWEPVVDVTYNAYISRPNMVIDSVGNINVIYRSGGVFYFTRSVDGGAVWSEGFSITGNADSADIGVDGRGTVYVIWGDTDTDQLNITVSSL